MRCFERILIDVDPHAVHHPELDRGIAIARAAHAEVLVAGVMTTRDLPPLPGLQGGTENIDELKERLATLAAGLTGVSASSALLFGSPAEALTEQAHRWGADLLVRSHSRDTVQPQGGIGRRLIRDCPAPVLLLGPGEAPRHTRILGAVAPDDGRNDVAALNRTVVEFTVSIATMCKGSPILFQAFKLRALQLAHDSRLKAVACVDQWRTDTTARLAVAVDDIGADPENVELVARHGAVDDVLPEFIVSHGVDLVVMGVPARRGLARWMLGTTAERLLRYTPCSVLAVK